MLRGGSKEMHGQGSNDLVLTAGTSHPICHTFLDLTMDGYPLSNSVHRLDSRSLKHRDVPTAIRYKWAGIPLIGFFCSMLV